MSRVAPLMLAAALGAIPAMTPAQAPSSAAVDPQTLRRPRATWNQAEREFGFANWDKVFPTRTIRRGERAHALPEGAPLPSFEAGGTGAAQLHRNVDGFKLAGIVVLHDGKVRLERYALGHTAAGRWTSFSMAKSLTGTLVGAAIRDGHIGGADDLVTRYIPELAGSAYDGVTLRQLLTMTSGARWNENYSDPRADVARYHSAPIEPGMDASVSYMRRLARDAAPGAKWRYSTGETNLVGIVVSRATRKDLATYAAEKIWARYGMEADAFWMIDRTGHEHGGCCIQATTRDFARFGQFVLDGARIDGRSIVADGWLEAATRTQVGIGRPGFGYGYQWWTREDGTFSALGIHGQQVHVDPARRLVVAINSAWPTAESTPDSVAARAALLDAIRAAVDVEARDRAGR